MYDRPERIAAFEADLRRLRIPDPATARDRLAGRVGLATVALGIGLAVLAYALSHATTNPLQQRDAIVLALAGVALATGGSALYLKAALAGFLRFWLLRAIHEQRAQTDRVVTALERQDPCR
jgi:fatty acid desaturase